MSWGVFEERDDVNYFVAFHTIPMIKIDGELHRSDDMIYRIAAHVILDLVSVRME